MNELTHTMLELYDDLEYHSDNIGKMTQRMNEIAYEIENFDHDNDDAEGVRNMLTNHMIDIQQNMSEYQNAMYHIYKKCDTILKRVEANNK